MCKSVSSLIFTRKLFIFVFESVGGYENIQVRKFKEKVFTSVFVIQLVNQGSFDKRNCTFKIKDVEKQNYSSIYNHFSYINQLDFDG